LAHYSLESNKADVYFKSKRSQKNLGIKRSQIEHCKFENSTQYAICFTLRGWLVALHNTSFAVPEFNFKNIFSFLEIVLPTGLTYEGKQKGMLRQNSPSRNNIFWDHLILTEKMEPPLN
jgi:hypothetical protein